MAKRGRKKLPTNILKIRGSRQLEYRPKNEPVPKAGMPKPPKDLDGAALEHWFVVAQMLFEQGTLTLIDATVLAAYCDAYALYQQVKRECRIGRDEPVLMLKSKNGNMYLNPMIGLLKSTKNDMCRLAAEFGMSPSGRSSINVPKPKTKEQTKAQKWVDKNRA